MKKYLITTILAIVFCQGILQAQMNQMKDTTVYTLGFSTYLSHTDKYASGFDIFTDSEGFTYVSGNTRDKNFPATEGAYQTELKGSADVFVVKYSPEGDVVFATLIGGEKREHHSGITVDKEGYIYIAGGTESPDYPVTEGCYDNSFNGEGRWAGDVFVTKLNPTGTEIVFSTFIGGDVEDTLSSEGIQVDSQGNVIIAGVTKSINFPLTTGSIDEKDKMHGFISKFSSDGRELLFSTSFGNSPREGVSSITLDDKDNIYLIGSTYTEGLPVTDNAFRKEIILPTSGAYMDHYIAKIDANDHKISYLSYFATDAFPSASIRWINPNRLIVCGSTKADAFPVTDEAISKKVKGNLDCFFSVFNSETMSMEYTSLFGGSSYDRIMSAHFLNQDTIVIGGLTNSADFPLTDNALYSKYPECEPSFNASFLGLKKSFVSVIDLKNSKLLYSTYFGVSHIFRIYPDQYGNLGFVAEAGQKSQAGITGFPVTKDATEPPSYTMIGQLLLNKKPEPTKAELYKDVKVDESILETYVGKYELNPGFVLTICKPDSILKLQIPQQGEAFIYPKSQNRFYNNKTVLELTFNINEAGEVVSMTVHTDGGDDIICKRKEE